MAIYDIFSKRQKALSETPSDILVYDELPREIRVQIVHIFKDAFGEDKGYGGNAEQAYKYINKALATEYGVFQLAEGDSYKSRLVTFFLSTKDIERALDVVEFSFRYLKLVVGETEDYKDSVFVESEPDEAIDELNQRFKEHAIGYRFESLKLIRIDSTIIHSEVVKPALSLLSDKKFSGANEEYLKAHEHYRHGRNKECLNECLKAFESTMKIICEQKQWTFSMNDTSSTLIKACLTNNLIPPYLQTQLSSLKSVLESGIATIRNRVGGHGQGSKQLTADDETTRYALNLTGANIIYFVELSEII